MKPLKVLTWPRRLGGAFCISAVVFATGAQAEDPVMMTIDGAYLFAARPGAPAAAIYLSVTNATEVDDRLIGVETPVAPMAHLHRSVETDGVVSMTAVDALDIAAGETLALDRGGDHIMLMGLEGNILEQDTVPLTLIFEGAGTVTVDVPVAQIRNIQGN
jgi:copper(I)-binding protein